MNNPVAPFHPGQYVKGNEKWGPTAHRVRRVMLDEDQAWKLDLEGLSSEGTRWLPANEFVVAAKPELVAQGTQHPFAAFIALAM